ncbi:MAG: DUF2339 domain-containing protein [Lysobacterales bacterium]
MGYLIVVVSCIAGVFVGTMSGSDTGLALGFFTGLAIGVVCVRLRALDMRIETLQREVNALRVARRVSPQGITSHALPRDAAAGPATAAQPARAPVADAPPLAATTPADESVIDTSVLATAPPAPAPRAAPAGETVTPPRIAASSVARAPTPPDAFEKAVTAIRHWFTEGNVPVKIGMLVLFAGVAALLKYATDQGWLSVPIELRLAGIAAVAIGALAFGWRERTRRRTFALSLQGGAIGILLLTVFAALRLYHLLPAGAAFALLLALVAGTGILAVLQDALALAVLGLVAGFAAPILVSTGSGDHIVLFAYYLVLNLAILAIAWRKSWRALDLLGFFSTFAIGTAWGVLRYEHALFASTEPFLLAFFAIYIAVPILHAARGDRTRRDLVDGTLVFGNPLLAFALQAALLQGERMPLAWSALALAALYALLGWWQLPRRRVLGESFLVLAVGFATLAVPLALSARSTASTFALEGAALVWLGLRQQRRLPELSGLALQVLAAAAFLFGMTVNGVGDATPLANPTAISALLVALAAFASAWLYHRALRPTPAVVLYLWGLVWWCGDGLHEIDRFVPPHRHAAAVLAFVALTAVLATVATQRTRAIAVAGTAALALVAGIPVALWMGIDGVQPFAGQPLGALAAFMLAGVYALTTLRGQDGLTPAVGHTGWVWSWTCFAAVALDRIAAEAQLGSGWRIALGALPLLAAWSLALVRPQWIGVPLQQRFDGWRGSLLLQQAIVGACLFCILLWHAGDARPLPWLPLLNPVELVQLGTLILAARWLADPSTPDIIGARRAVVIAGAGFLFVTAATLRATHHLGGVPWDGRLLSSNLAQMALTLAWSVLGVIGWVAGSRRSQRLLWLAGAVLMGIVLAKLLLIDRTRLGNLFGIASFIGYGLLCTVIGYFAPAPPRAIGQAKGA